MPNLPTYRRRELPSTNIGAAPLPVSAANVAGDAIGQGIAALGGGVSDLGGSIAKIKQADNQNKDLLAESRLSTAIKDEELAYKELTEKDGDVNNYAGYRKQSIDRINALKDTLEWGNSTTKQRADLFASGWSSTFTRESEIGIISKRSEEAIKVTELNLVSSLSKLGATSGSEQELLNKRAEEAYREALSFKYGPDMIELFAQSAKSDGAKGRARNYALAGDFGTARKIINEEDFGDPKDRVAMLNAIDAIEAKATLDNDREIESELEVIDNIVTLPQDEFLAQAPAALERINKSEILPVKGKNDAGKEGQRKKINDRIKAIAEGKADPIGQFDPVAYSNIERRITQNSMMVKGTDITNLVGKGTSGGITAAQAKDLTALKKFYDGADILGTDLHRIYSGAIVGLRTSKTFSRDKADNALYAARASAALNAWAVKNPNATESDYQDFFDRLMDRSQMDNWGRGWFIREKEEQKVAIRENIQSFEEELGIETAEVISPSGEKGTIPVSQLKEALKEGYKEVK